MIKQTIDRRNPVTGKAYNPTSTSLISRWLITVIQRRPNIEKGRPVSA